MNGSRFLFLRVVTLYGVGSLMGALALAVNWLVREFLGGGLAILATQPTLDDYYMPMVWGGVCGLLFLCPIRFVSWVGRGIVLGLVPGLIYLSLKAGGWERMIDFLSPDRFLRHDTLIILLVYMFVWGIGTSYIVGKQHL